MGRRAQATVEMAVFGSLILIVLITLFSYMQRFNDEQYAIMTGFRKAMAKAKEIDGSASYVVFDSRRYTGGDFFRKGSSTNVSGDGSVLWGKSDESKYIWNVNGTEYEIPKDVSEKIETTTVEAKEDSSETMKKKEDASGISTTFGYNISKAAQTINFIDEVGNVVYSIAQNRPSSGNYTWMTEWQKPK